MLYLCSPSWTNRTGKAEKPYRVFTNLPAVELFHQGKSLGVQTNDFTWTVTLQPGANELRARAGKREHSFMVNYTSAPVINTTPVITVHPEAANPFKTDQK